jgi:tetratricopeptide (TPR) repeat protein
MNRKLRRALKHSRHTHRVSDEHSRHNKLASTPNSGNETALFAQGVRHQLAGEAAEAVALYDRMLSFGSQAPEVHCNRGAALAGLGKLAEAETAYCRAIVLRPNFADAYYNLGNALRAAERLDEAESALRRAVRLRPNCARYHLNLGHALLLQGKLTEAEAATRSAITIDPQWADAYNNLGEILRCLGRLEESEKALRHAIAIRPQFVEALSSLGNTLKEQCKLAEAEAAHRQAISINPNFAAGYNNLGAVLLDLGRLNEAELIFRRAVTLEPRFVNAFGNLASVLRAQGRPAEAEAACRRAIALDPKCAEAYCRLGDALVDQARLIEAEAAYRRAIELKPSFADAYNNLGGVLKFLGRVGEARCAIEHAIKLAPRDASYFLSICDLRRFEPEDQLIAAMEHETQNISSKSIKEQIVLRFALAKVYDDIGRHDDAFRQLLEGNAFKRRQVHYNETAMLALFGRMQAVFTPELIETFQDSGEASAVPIFVIGMPRAGTTLIEQIMASHARVFGAGELPTLGRVAGCAFSNLPSGLSFPDAMSGIGRDDLQRLGALYVSQIRALNPTAAHIINKMPGNFLFAGLIHLALPNAKIVHVFRDAVDTCLSCFSTLFVTGQDHTYDLAELGRYYRHYQTLMEHWDRVLPHGRILQIRYEDVVADLEGQARRIFTHCGLEWDSRCLAFNETERPICTASAAQVRRPIYKTAIGRSQPYRPFLQPLLAELISAVLHGGTQPVSCVR